MTRDSRGRPWQSAVSRAAQWRQTAPLHVLVLDASAAVREVLRAVLLRDQAASIAVAADANDAKKLIRQYRPDVIVLDLETRELNGLEFLRQLMKDDPLPVVVRSGPAANVPRRVFQALASGAVDVIAMPRANQRVSPSESRRLIADTIRAAAAARIGRRRTDALEAPLVTVRPSSEGTPAKERIVAIGGSTGGAEAMRRVLAALPETAPGTLIGQQMPEGMTAAFAEYLNEKCALQVKEAADGDSVCPGRALVAPGGRHLRLRRAARGYTVTVTDEPRESAQKPSIDVLFESLAREAGPGAVAVVLSGEGASGADGTLHVRRSGGVTIAQDEASSVAFGMPKQAIEVGGAQYVVSLSRIPDAILAATRLPESRQNAGSDPDGAGGSGVER